MAAIFSKPPTQEYRDNFDRVFRGQEPTIALDPEELGLPCDGKPAAALGVVTKIDRKRRTVTISFASKRAPRRRKAAR